MGSLIGPTLGTFQKLLKMEHFQKIEGELTADAVSSYMFLYFLIMYFLLSLVRTKFFYMIMVGY